MQRERDCSMRLAIVGTALLHLVALVRPGSGAVSLGVAPEPWPVLNHGAWTGPDQPYSPDPLVQYEFNAGTNDTVLQIFAVAAVAVGPSPGTSVASFLNTSSAVGSTSCSITVQGNGTLVVDFGVEMPAWLEFDSFDLKDASGVVLGISEYTVVDYVGGFKSGAPVKVGCSCVERYAAVPTLPPRPRLFGTPQYCSGALCTYRLETNSELYEGVRYGFVILAEAPSVPFTITGLRAVSQVR